jgi:hypothetical protein
MLLTDVFLIERLQIINEGSEGKTMRVRGVFQRAEESNSNGRIYPQNVLNKQLDKLQPLIEGRRLCGELDHPTNDTVKLSNASHLITKLEMKGNEVIGEAEILNTPAGLTARALINGGVKIGISSRGMGTLSENSEGKKIVNEDFNLITFDLVADPSTRGAYPELTESKKSKFINESKQKLEKESNLVKILKARFDEAYSQYNEAKLIGKQKNLDVDRDGQIEGSDLAMLRKRKGKKSIKGKGKKQAKTNLKKMQKLAFLKKKLSEENENIDEAFESLKGRVKRAGQAFFADPPAGAPAAAPAATAVAPKKPGLFGKIGQSLGGIYGAAKKGFDAGYAGKPIFDTPRPTPTPTPQAPPTPTPEAPPTPKETFDKGGNQRTLGGALATIRAARGASYNRKLKNPKIKGASRDAMDAKATRIASGLAGMGRGLSSRQAGLEDQGTRDELAVILKADRARMKAEKEAAMKAKMETSSKAYIGIGKLIAESGAFNNLVNRLKRRL